MNRDFIGFANLSDRFIDEFGGRNNDAIKAQVAKSVEYWFSVTMVETYLGLRSLQRLDHWTDDQVTNALSEESLTAMCMQRMHQSNAIHKELRGVLGSPSKK